jgi:uncharacterized protein (DUF1810 family)
MVPHSADDPFDLERFVTAQDECRDSVLGELRRGRKTTHWMWFVFPQLAALGRSSMARHYGIDSSAEAAAYWHHPVLGPRLAETVELAIAAAPRSVHDIFGSPDDLKFRSCITLFDQVATDSDVFRRALATFFDGKPDPATLALLRSG